MHLKAIHILIILPIVFILAISSCRKTKTLTVGGKLQFSLDTLKFDTVFTTQGSYTNGFLIYNLQNEDVIISSVRIQNRADTFFHLNVDGFSGNNISNLKIRAHDSIYVFATVKINPNDSLTPFYITENIITTLNGKDFTIPVTAYGQNAHFIVSDSIGINTTWLTDLPYVIIHYAVVGQGVTLTIPPKCRIYLHQDARIFVYGTLEVGDSLSYKAADSVVFQGDRLDRVYFGYMGYPGEWGGMYFINGSWGNINHAVIKNCGGSTSSYLNFQTQSAAVEVDSGARLTINRSIIENSIGYGILDFQGTVNAANCLIYGTGAGAFITLKGGGAKLTNCTFANYGSSVVNHSTNTTVALINYLPIGNGQYITGNLNAVLNNCIVYGSLDSEIICDTLAASNTSITLNHCLLKTGSYFQSFINFNSCIRNRDPLFKSTMNADFHLTTGSQAIGNGDATFYPGQDLEGKSYHSPPDIGCYQFYP